MPITLTCQCGKSLRVKDELAGKRIKCPACGQIIAILPAITLKKAKDDSKTVRSASPAAAVTRVISTRIVHRYTVNDRAGEGIGKVAITPDCLDVYRLNKLLFLFLVGPFLGLITPIRKFMTNIRIISFPLRSISCVENTSPRSHESMKITFSDGQRCEFRLSWMGKARLFDKMKADIDKALEQNAGRKLVETKPNVWRAGVLMAKADAIVKHLDIEHAKGVVDPLPEPHTEMCSEQISAVVDHPSIKQWVCTGLLLFAGALMLLSVVAPWATLTGQVVPFPVWWSGLDSAGIHEMRINNAILWAAPSFGVLGFVVLSAGLGIFALGVSRAFGLRTTQSTKARLLATLLNVFAVIALLIAVLRIIDWQTQSYARVRPGTLTASFGTGIAILSVAVFLGLLGGFIWPSHVTTRATE